MVGTDPSTGTYLAQLFTTQADNDVRDSELDELLVGVRINVGSRREPIKTVGVTENNLLKSRKTPNSRSSQLVIDDCLRMIQVVYDRMIHDTQLKKSLYQSDSVKVGGKPIELNQRELTNYNGGNKTHIETKIYAVPGAFVSNIFHGTKGEATSNDVASDQERQTHGYFKNSKIFQTSISVGIPNTQ